MNVTIDSAGRVLQYHERRGLLHIPVMAEVSTAAARVVALCQEAQGDRGA